MGKVTYDASVWEALKLQVEKLSGAHVRIGVLTGPHENADITIAELAVIHELGAPAAGIPERSFIRASLERARPEMVQFIAKLAKAVVLGRITSAQAHGLLGEWAVAKVRDYILEGQGVPPPLKDATIARKGSARPLVDTGQLLHSISYAVEAGGADSEEP